MKMRLVGLLVLMTALAVFLSAPSLGGAAPSTHTYTLSGSTTITPNGCFDCSYSSTTTGSATCSACLPTDPLTGSFSLSLPTITTYPPSPCRIKTLSGTLSATWANGKTSTANLTGRFIDAKPDLHLAGSFDVSDLEQWAADKVGIVINNYPTSPCTASTNPVSATLVITG